MSNHRESDIASLGRCEIPSPLLNLLPAKTSDTTFVNDDDRAIAYTHINKIKQKDVKATELTSFELAGPRRNIFFDPAHTSAAIVTCGGLCPGLNNVIRSLTLILHFRYGIRRILGIRNGYQGFIKKYKLKPIPLNPDFVDHIHEQGGTVLGTSRGNQDKQEIVDFLVENKIDILFLIGGDGTLRGALEISKLAQKDKVPVSFIGIPKTVDNDILYIDRSFGFASASSIACSVIKTAHTEAKSQHNGIGLVKVMGRQSGFIACLSSLAVNDANFVLIPEVPFDLKGESGLLKSLKDRMLRRGHAVILVAEGAGQDLMQSESVGHDESGNIRLNDIGIFLKDKINSYFKESNIEINLKYIDPSYIIRAIPAEPTDSVYCYMLGEHAVHAGMSGKTEAVIGLVNNTLVHVPMSMIAQGRRQVKPDGPLWFSVLESTGQPPLMN